MTHEDSQNDVINPLPPQWQGIILPFEQQIENEKIEAEYQDKKNHEACIDNLLDDLKERVIDVEPLISTLLGDLQALFFSIEENTEHLEVLLSPIMKNCTASAAKEASPVLYDADSELAKELKALNHRLQKHLNVLIELRENCQL